MTLRNAFEDLATDSKLELARILLASIDGKLAVNADSRLQVSVLPSRYDLETMALNAAGMNFAASVDSASNIMLHCKANPTVSGHIAYFEASLDSTDGVNGTWFAVQAVRSNANTIETYTGATALAATPAYGWEVSVNACKWVRVRCSAHTSGEMIWMLQKGSYATEPIPAAQGGAVTASVRGMGPYQLETSTNLAAGATFTGSARAIGTSTAQYYGRFRVRVASSHSGTLTVEFSRDASNYKSVPSETNIAIVAGVVTLVDFSAIGYYARVKFTNTDIAATTSLEIVSAALVI